MDRKLKIIIYSAIIVLFVGGIYYYSNYYLAGRTELSGMSEKLQKSGTLVFDMARDLQARLPKSFDGLIEKENAGDFHGAIEIVEGSLSIVNELEQKNGALKLETEGFKSTAENLSKKEAVDSASELADIMGRLVLQFGKMVELERELLNMAKNYYQDLSENPAIEAPSFIEINAKIAVASNDLSSLLSDFALKANDLNTIINGKPISTEDEASSEKAELKIEDIALGQSEEAKNGDTLIVHYEGYLEDGTKFDSSVDRGQPFTFVLGSGQVIQGWERGMLGIKIGGHRRLTVPPELGYGTRGQGNIPPNSTLIFEIDLLDIK